MRDFGVISILVLAVVAFVRPRRADCPHGWWLDEGVRSSGVFECAPLTPEQAATGPHGGWIDASAAAPLHVLGRVYCGAGERAQTSDGVAVFCGAGAWL